MRYLDANSEHDLFSEDILRCDRVLRDALYADLDRCWSVSSGAVRTHALLPEWMRREDHLRSHSRFGSSLLNGVLCGSSELRVDLSKACRVSSCLCRRGCGVQETVEHVLLDCGFYSELRERLMLRCRELGFEFCIRTLLVEPQVYPLTEEILQALVQ